MVKNKARLLSQVISSKPPPVTPVNTGKGEARSEKAVAPSALSEQEERSLPLHLPHRTCIYTHSPHIRLIRFRLPSFMRNFLVEQQNRNIFLKSNHPQLLKVCAGERQRVARPYCVIPLPMHATRIISLAT